MRIEAATNTAPGPGLSSITRTSGIGGHSILGGRRMPRVVAGVYAPIHRWRRRALHDLGHRPPSVMEEPQKGSPFEVLYLSTRPSMVRFASFLVDSRAEAEELVQDAYVDLFRQWDTAVDPPALLRTLVVRRCRRSLRRRIDERRKLELVGRRDGSGRSGSGARDVDAVSAIRRLRSDRRAVVVMRFYLDMSHARIADALDCSVGTARTRLHRALADLRRSMGEVDAGAADPGNGRAVRRGNR